MRNKLPKSLIGKLGIAAAVGLISSNLLTPLSYPVLARDAGDTATYEVVSDGYVVTYNGKSYKLAKENLSGTFKWGNNTAGDSTSYAGSQYNNQWGGGLDTEENGNDSGNPRSERQGPCPTGWHVPSRGEWQKIVTAWCHLEGKNCTASDLTHVSSYGNLNYISKSGLGAQFKTDFGMSGNYFWSSSPYLGYASYAWYFYVDNGFIEPGRSSSRNSSYPVRCLENSTSAGGSSSEQGSSPSSSALTWADVESGSLAETLIDKLLSFIMPNHDVYLYAIAAPNTYHVAYSGNQATSGTMENSTFTYDTAGTLRANAFEREGYTFSGWNTKADNSGTGYANGASVLNWTATDGDTIEIYAQWKAKNDTPYVVYHYIKELGSDTYILSGIDNLNGTTDTEVVFNTKLKTFTGFTYSGGYLTGGETRPAGAGLTTGSIDKDGNLKIYLYYDRDYNNVYLNGSKGIDTITGSGRYEYGADVTVSATPKTGYHFVRWEKRSSKTDLGLTD